MTTSHDVSHRLQCIDRDEGESVRAYHCLAEKLADPTADVVLALLARDAERDRTLLQRICAGALDVLQSTDSTAGDGAHDTGEIDGLSRIAARRARELRELASSERSLNRAPWAMLLEALAADNEKDASLLTELARYLGGGGRARVQATHRLNGKATPLVHASLS